MSRTISSDTLFAELPQERRDRIKAAADKEIAEIRGLQALRQMAEKSQAEMAKSLGVAQPGIHKLEKRPDLLVSSLRRFVEAAGGTLEIKVSLPGHGTFKLTGLAETAE